MEKNQGTAAQATKQLEKQSAHFSKTKTLFQNKTHTEMFTLTSKEPRNARNAQNAAN